MGRGRKEGSRQHNSPEQQGDIIPVRIPGGVYLNLADYARSEGITRTTAYNREARGKIQIIRIGENTVLVKLDSNARIT